MTLSRRSLLAGGSAGALAGRGADAAPGLRVRVGALAFGSAAWELAVVREHGLAPSLDIEVVPLAATPATQTALLGGRVDVIVQDWLWVSRQRAAGTALALSPTSGALGALIVPAASPIRTLADLAGRRLGVAGSPLDKSFLIVRAYAEHVESFDLSARVALQFAAPPRLAAELDAGRLDAVLTYWPFAARAEVAGCRQVLAVEQAVQALGVARGLPFVGFVFHETWARANPAALSAFLDAGRRARELLLHQDGAWDGLRSLVSARSEGEWQRLIAWYRSGVPGPMTPARVADAARLYDVLAAVGGAALVGLSPHLAPGTFWAG